MKLKLSEMASIAEVIGAAAVVISLIYVGLEVRDGTRAVRSTAINDANVSTQAWYRDIGTNRQASDVFLHSIISPEPLTVEDEFQFFMSMHAVLLGFQNSYLLAQEGGLDEEQLAGITTAVLGIKDLPGWERYWDQRRGYLHQGFAEYIDTLIERPPLNTVDIYRDAISTGN